MIRTNPLAALGLVLAAVGCNSFDEPSEVGPNDPVLVIPTDERPAVQAEKPPPPISGGTLAIGEDGRFAVAADSDRDRVAVVDLNSMSVQGIIPLELGDEPGRVVIDGSRRAFVALRRGGAVAVIDLESASLSERLELCSEPRGLALDAAAGLLHVACAGGSLVSVPTAGGAPTRTLDLGPDLRDVVVSSDGLMVSRFRSAEILHVDAAGNVRSTRPTSVVTSALHETRNGNETLVEPVDRRLTPSVAWRMISNGRGGALVLHERGVDGEIELAARTTDSPVSGSSYGGGSGGCDSIVQSAITEISSDDVQATSKPVAGVALGVDVALSPISGRLAIANAGLADPGAPEPHTVLLGDNVDVPFAGVGPGEMSDGSLRILTGQQLHSATTEPTFGSDCAFGEQDSGTPEPVVAVAWTPNDVLVAQTREPSRLVVIGAPDTGTRAIVELGGESVLDTGHEIFHRDSGGGIACASCHPEGREDGRVWQFAGVGMRRTQPLDVGLEGTAPFHWTGDLPGLSSLVDEVFVNRMGGVLESRDRLKTLERWLYARQPLTPRLAADDPSVERGRALFDSVATGCATCHAGEKLTSSGSFQVRQSGETMQVPSLVGVGYRAPFMHDGCAATLEGRFDPECGGGQLHGNTAGLDSSQIGDLVSYLESL